MYIRLQQKYKKNNKIGQNVACCKAKEKIKKWRLKSRNLKN